MKKILELFEEIFHHFIPTFDMLKFMFNFIFIINMHRISFNLEKFAFSFVLFASYADWF